MKIHRRSQENLPKFFFRRITHIYFINATRNFSENSKKISYNIALFSLNISEYEWYTNILNFKKIDETIKYA